MVDTNHLYPNGPNKAGITGRLPGIASTSKFSRLLMAGNLATLMRRSKAIQSRAFPHSLGQTEMNALPITMSPFR
jgi:hypothetical protein